MGGKRLRVEALLAAAASPLPPPVADLVPDPTLADDLFPDDLPAPAGPAAGADLYLQDEVEVALHPTLTRVWSRRGRRGQRLVEAPGTNHKRYGFGLVDWRDGWLDWALAEGRRAAPFCAQLRRALARSRRAGGSPSCCWTTSASTPPGSRLLRALLAEAGRAAGAGLHPDLRPRRQPHRVALARLRRAVTHCHQRETLDPLLADADRVGRRSPRPQVLSQIGSPFAPDQRPAIAEELNHAA